MIFLTGNGNSSYIAILVDLLTRIKFTDSCRLFRNSKIGILVAKNQMMKALFLGCSLLWLQAVTAQNQLTTEQAARLVALPLKCAQQEYPNKLGQVLNDSTGLLSPATLHPAFYGCFDWHSSVHGHWLMVTILKQFPGIENATDIRKVLSEQLTATNIQTEIAFFSTKFNYSFERTYGWAWILKLQQELDTWNDPMGKTCAENLRPLSNLICRKYYTFLPKLVYPIRSGDHINTAFGLTFAYDYAVHTSNDSLKQIITKRSIDFYQKDANYPLKFEPSGYDFLSGALEEVDLMRRVLPKAEFQKWLKVFLPELFSKKFQLEPGKIIDRTDGKLVHLDGLNFSRGWCLYNLGKSDKRFAHLIKVADQHMDASLPNITDGDYMGEHWLASFALLALLSR